MDIYIYITNDKELSSRGKLGSIDALNDWMHNHEPPVFKSSWLDVAYMRREDQLCIPLWRIYANRKSLY